MSRRPVGARWVPSRRKITACLPTPAPAGVLAVATSNNDLLNKSIAALKGLNLPGVYWPKMRDLVVAELLEKEIPAKSRLARLLRLTSMYLDLKPGLFGVSININAVLDKMADKLEGRP